MYNVNPKFLFSNLYKSQSLKLEEKINIIINCIKNIKSNKNLEFTKN